MITGHTMQVINKRSKSYAIVEGSNKQIFIISIIIIFNNNNRHIIKTNL